MRKLDSYSLLADTICRLLLSGRISVFDLTQLARYYDSRFYFCELTRIKCSGGNYEETLKRILFELTEINDILKKEIMLSQLFKYCEANGMSLRNFNPFYCRQRELEYYKSEILKLTEKLLEQEAKDSSMQLSDGFAAFLSEYLNQHTHVMAFHKYESHTDIFMVKYKDNPIWNYMASEIYFYRLTNNQNPLHCAHVNIKEEALTVRIGDFIVNSYDINRGYGSILMDYLKEFSEARGKVNITGSLSPFDLSTHKERLLHFYKKHDFIISKPNDKGWCSIQCNLKK